MFSPQELTMPFESLLTYDAWGAQAQYYNPLSFRNSWASSTQIYSSAGYERRLYNATKNNYEGHAPKEYYPPLVWINPAQSDQAALLKTNITNYIQSNMDQFITGAKDINNDSVWNQYVAGFNGLQLSQYLKIYQQAYTVTTKG